MLRPTQRRITLIRHAKAEDDGMTADHLRPLNPRGREDAAALGSWMKAQGALPELIICSTALRTRQTLEGLGLGNVATVLSDKAYLASAGELLALLQGVDDAVGHVAILAHNPGLHQLAAMLPGSYASADDEQRLMLKFPTCAYASYAVSATDWPSLALAKAQLTTLRLATDA